MHLRHLLRYHFQTATSVESHSELRPGPNPVRPVSYTLTETEKKALEKIKQIDPATAAASAKAIKTGKATTVATTTAKAQSDATKLAETAKKEVAKTALPEATKP